MISEVSEELKQRVIRAYTEKKMSFNIIGKFICDRAVAERIIREAGIEIKKSRFGSKGSGFNIGKNKTYSTSWEELQKSRESGNN